MSVLNFIPKKILFFFAGVIVVNLLTSCGIWNPADARKVSPNVNERVKKNLEEG